ncbi:MAG: GYD domain-containing protein [Bacteroidales bacterium]|nr:GYD domain-containing protein [Bacteroidales bacterium]
MATYFMFGKYTPDAMKGINASRTEKAGKLVQKFGGEIKSMYALLGEKDLVIIANFPGIEQAVKSSIAMSRLTGIAFTTSEAIFVEDFDRMISEI